MKTRMIMLALAVGMSVASFAKDIRTVVLTTAPQMHCENCENRIKSNIRFEKGIKEIVTDLKSKTVTIKYDAEKTNVKNIIAGFAKINYKASVVETPTNDQPKK
ncbi:MAG: heavy-metal-associated domain-containing protein [Mediterranea sp.]|nr:heavy-metal-associated domain-containing protein [Mediterranea sp.]